MMRLAAKSSVTVIAGVALTLVTLAGCFQSSTQHPGAGPADGGRPSAPSTWVAPSIDPSGGERLALVAEFLRAFNAGDVAAVMRTLGPFPLISACDYASGRAREFGGREEVIRWLSAQANDEARLEWRSIGSANPGSTSLGVDIANVRSNWLTDHGYPDGVRPAVGVKVRFTSGDRIEAFAMSQVGGPPDACMLG